MVRLLIFIPLMFSIAVSLTRPAAPVGYIKVLPVAEPNEIEEQLLEIEIMRILRSLKVDPNAFDPHRVIAKGRILR